MDPESYFSEEFNECFKVYFFPGSCITLVPLSSFLFSFLSSSFQKYLYNEQLWKDEIVSPPEQMSGLHTALEGRDSVCLQSRPLVAHDERFGFFKLGTPVL